MIVERIAVRNGIGLPKSKTFVHVVCCRHWRFTGFAVTRQ
jgi:hypothetical protein